MSFFELFAANYIGQFISTISTLYIISTLLNKKIRLTKHSMLVCPIVLLCFILLVTAITYPEIQKYGGYGAGTHIVIRIIAVVTLFSLSVYLFGKCIIYHHFNISCHVSSI